MTNDIMRCNNDVGNIPQWEINVVIIDDITNYIFLMGAKFKSSKL